MIDYTKTKEDLKVWLIINEEIMLAAHHYCSNTIVFFQQHFPWLFPKHLELFCGFLGLYFPLVFTNYEIYKYWLFLLDIHKRRHFEGLNQETEVAKKRQKNVKSVCFQYYEQSKFNITCQKIHGSLSEPIKRVVSKWIIYRSNTKDNYKFMF